MKTQSFEKKGIIPVKKKTWPIFSVLSSMTKLKEPFIRVHEVSGIYCGKKDQFFGT